MQEAEADRQKTFLRLALNAAARLPWTLPLMRSGGFVHAVSRLQKTPCAYCYSARLNISQVRTGIPAVMCCSS